MRDNGSRAEQSNRSRAANGVDMATARPSMPPTRRVSDPVVREFLLTFWKIHILHHAEDERGIYGLWMLEELHHHGYRLSPGTLYPILSRMARRGWIKAVEPRGSRDARVYRITPAGAEVLQRLRSAIAELKHEVGECRPIRGAESPSSARSRRGRPVHEGVKNARSE
jgi:DNA-binding PadR family transcriptional regulator